MTYTRVDKFNQSNLNLFLILTLVLPLYTILLSVLYGKLQIRHFISGHATLYYKL